MFVLFANLSCGSKTILGDYVTKIGADNALREVRQDAKNGRMGKEYVSFFVKEVAGFASKSAQREGARA